MWGVSRPDDTDKRVKQGIELRGPPSPRIADVLDVIAFSTLVLFAIDYFVCTMLQASRHSWCIGQ